MDRAKVAVIIFCSAVPLFLNLTTQSVTVIERGEQEVLLETDMSVFY